jgi:hypothetical protein
MAAKEFVQKCVSEFISFITSEASQKCAREKRKTVNGSDLIWALSILGAFRCDNRLTFSSSRFAGFDTYVRNLNVYLHNLRVEEEVRIPALLAAVSIIAHALLQEAKSKKKCAPHPSAGGAAQ